MDKNHRSLALASVLRFQWASVFLAILVSIQLFISLDTISGYPADMWPRYFMKWWIFTGPPMIFGMALVSASNRMDSKRRKSVGNILGRGLIFLSILSNYLSLLAIG